MAKMIKVARMPVHLRWDLYPIPHERGKSDYGGSYFENVDWWTKPKEVSLANELKEMGKEIIVVHSVYENNRPLWIFSFPFHFGMYCLIGFALLLIVGAIMGISGIDVSAASSNTLAVIIHYLTSIIGPLGYILSILGAIGLLVSRIFRTELNKSTVLSDYTNLLILISVFVFGFLSYLVVDPSFGILRAYIGNLITFKSATVLPTLVTIQLWLFVILLFYFPFTHMTHAFGKYFTYHKIRWEDSPNIRGSKLEQNVQHALGYRVGWSAPHIKTGATWAEAATATEEDSKNE
jgi:nitrate reductase gamma subunit